MRREITVGGGHASGQIGWWHFGLGDAAQAEVRVVWPDGTAGDWQTVDGNNFYIIRARQAGLGCGLAGSRPARLPLRSTDCRALQL